MTSLVERTAEALHDAWCQVYEDAGWVFGEVRDRERKTHPHLRPFAECGLENNNQDRFMAAVVLEHLAWHGLGSVEGSQHFTATLIHQAWALYVQFDGRPGHPHIGIALADHDALGTTEHYEQARRVLALWEEHCGTQS